MELFNPNNAVYLPAVNSGYIASANKRLPKGRRFPEGLTPSDLIFWEDNNLWHYPFLLHSIGQYRVGARPSTLLDKVNRRKSLLVGDSGGYQIGKGTLLGLQYVKRGPMKASDAIAAWRKERVARNWIKDWLSQQCDYGMTIDMPLWATSQSGSRSPFHRCSSQQLMAMTNQNLRLIDSFSPARAKWLNVVQGGETYLDTIDWYHTVKWFQRGGWALAGSAGVAGGLVNFLMTVLFMRDEDAFRPGQDWLHVLGVSTPLWAIVLTAVQQQLRRQNSSLTVSFDSSSPFLLGGRFEQACLRPKLTNDKGTWAMSVDRAPQRPAYAKETCTKPFPYPHSPLGKVLKLNELNVKEGMWEPRQFDSLSNALLVNHNIWTHLDAFSRANDLVANGNSQALPPEFRQCIDLIHELFQHENAIDASYELEKHLKLLDSIAPMTI